MHSFYNESSRNPLVILRLITVLRFTMHTLSYLALTISGQVPEKAVRTLSYVRRTGSYLESLFEECSVHQSEVSALVTGLQVQCMHSNYLIP